jgi:hypothetical protein
MWLDYKQGSEMVWAKNFESHHESNPSLGEMASDRSVIAYDMS